MRDKDKKVPRNFRLTDKDYQDLQEVGAGNASDGIRFLLDAFRWKFEKEEEYQSERVEID